MKIICTNVFKGSEVDRAVYTAAWVKLMPKIIREAREADAEQAQSYK